MKSSDYPMISVAEAWRRIEAQLRPLPPTPHILAGAAGLVLAANVVAAEDIPPVPTATMDGYAVVAGDAQPTRTILAQQAAGSADAPPVTPGTAVRIMTGAPLPAGADAVIPFEETTETDGMVTVAGSVSPGLNLRPPASDIGAGQTVLAAGSRIGPPEIGLLASLGQTTVMVHPRPLVAILSTGEELVPPEVTPASGQIRDSNSLALAAAVTEAGCTALPLGTVPDREPALRSAILDGLARADGLLTSGGVSMGVKDLVKPLLAELGTVHFGRVAQKPGKPLTFASVGGKPVFGLPGFPVSSLVCFENLVRPALRLLAGHIALWRPEVPVRLTHDIRRDRERLEFVRATVDAIDGVLWATPTGAQASSRLASLVGSDALLRVEAGPDYAYAGDEVIAILTNRPERASR